MNIIEKQKLLRETIDTIKTSAALLEVKTMYDRSYPISGKYFLFIRFSEKAVFEIKYDLFSNFIFIHSEYNSPSHKMENEKYEKILKEYNLKCATPKKMVGDSNGIIQHYFKISEANCRRLYDIFTIIAKIELTC